MINTTEQATLDGRIIKKTNPPKEGYIKDRATGKFVDGRKPEEAVRQEYEKILHEDYDYDYEQMDIEVFIQRGSRIKPKNDGDRADIVIYKTSDNTRRHQNEDIEGIVETKRPGSEEGVDQLKTYMSASSAKWGVWTNGQEIKYLYKDPEEGTIKEDVIFNIPRREQSFEDIGRLSKKDLKPIKNLKPIFRRILNVLYANTNISRKEKLGSEMIKLLFCKIWDEKYDPGKPPAFMIRFKEDSDAVKKRVEELFKKVKDELADDGIFDKGDKILIDAKSVAYVVGELEQFALMKTDKDIVGSAFEVFAESKFVGEKGEFFTPREVVKMCVRMIDPEPNETVFDPACGSGGFMIYALEHVWRKMEADPKYSDSSVLFSEKQSIARKNFFGIDKEIDLVKIAKAYMAIVGDGKGNIIQENTLKNLSDYDYRGKALFTEDGESPKKFDIILTNPPFGAKIKITDKDILRQFDLGHKWVEKDGRWIKTDKIQETEPQLLFIERCLDFLKDGGRMAIVLPDGVFGNPTDGWVRQYIKEKAEILAIVDSPPETFMPHTHTKTSVLFLRKWKETKKTDYPIFCGIVKKCGHDARGNDIYRPDGRLDEEFSEVADNYIASPDREIDIWDRKGFTLYEGKLKNDILIPRYYNPDTQKLLKELEDSQEYNLKTIGQLEEEKLLEIRGAGSTVRPTDYGTGDIPFIRTSDISNWEINHDGPHRVARELYIKYKDKQKLRPNDILFVKDGTFLIGDTALITEYDLEVLVQSHFLIIHSLDHEKLNPYLLLYLLNSEIVRVQIDERTFVQATLSTIGNRLSEVYLPIPKSNETKTKIIETMKKVLHRAKMREEIRQALSIPIIATRQPNFDSKTN